MASFLRQHDSLPVTTTEELSKLLLVDVNVDAKYKQFVQKQQKGITYRNRLLEAFSGVGFMIILDPRWSEDAMEARNGMYHKAIKSLAKSLGAHGVHPLASSQVDVVQALLALAQHTGTRWLAETVDEFVRDTAGCLVFVPWRRFRHPDDEEDTQERLRGQFARRRSICPNWPIAIPGVPTTGHGSALMSTPRALGNADAGPEPATKRRRVE
ncbi:hypothetical protein EXIGLDRAFT_37768 [Exidia glandulosa HHB12029]|uniref:Uncharacterized protein n=1 Tax=Exidia glandulosa HHB12029 TaxID=1314781 RepID=A0A165IQ62_EXIGL|nr:hypothetical protein EXIGLDRAFT_37768 [Exidia glandulosa HHB12029]